MSVCHSPRLTNKTFIYANSLVLALSWLFHFLTLSRASQINLAHKKLFLNFLLYFQNLILVSKGQVPLEDDFPYEEITSDNSRGISP